MEDEEEVGEYTAASGIVSEEDFFCDDDDDLGAYDAGSGMEVEEV